MRNALCLEAFGPLPGKVSGIVLERVKLVHHFGSLAFRGIDL